MEKTRTIEQKYTVCDFCEKELDFAKDKIQVFTGDFPSMGFHVEPCLRQAAAIGRNRNKVTEQTRN